MIAYSSAIAVWASLMPSAKTTKFALLDTNAHIENFRLDCITFTRSVLRHTTRLLMVDAKMLWICLSPYGNDGKTGTRHSDAETILLSVSVP